MGGYGSGKRWTSSKRDTVDQHRSLDVNTLHRTGCLRPGFVGGWQWSRDGQQVANISFSFADDVLRLKYRIRAGSADWQDVVEPVPIHWSACRFGGQRPYFRCPGIKNGRACQRLVQKLHGASKYFLCRHCYDLSYASQCEDRFDRAMRQADRLRRRLGGQNNLFDTIPPRPKGMWQRTYNRIIEQIEEFDDAANEKLFLFAARLTKKERTA